MLRLDQPRAHDPRLARTYPCAKILGALILDELCGEAVSLPSGGARSSPRPLSLWRLQHMLPDRLTQAVKGVALLAALKDGWGGLRPHLCDSPRRGRRRSLADLPVLSSFPHA